MLGGLEVLGNSYSEPYSNSPLIKLILSMGMRGYPCLNFDIKLGVQL